LIVPLLGNPTRIIQVEDAMLAGFRGGAIAHALVVPETDFATWWG
jgi:hypothetical protein